MLSPVLEKLAREYWRQVRAGEGGYRRSPEVAGQFGVRSIPAVFGVRDGAVVDAFVGVQPESAIRAGSSDSCPPRPNRSPRRPGSWKAPIPRPPPTKYAQALALAARPARGPDRPGPDRPGRGQVEDATARLAALERRGFLEPEAERLKAELTLRTQAEGAGSVEAARAALAAHPDDLKLKFALAEALAAVRPVRRRPGPLPGTGRARSQGDRRAGPPDHGRHLPALASGRRAGDRLSAAALAGPVSLRTGTALNAAPSTLLIECHITAAAQAPRHLTIRETPWPTS